MNTEQILTFEEFVIALRAKKLDAKMNWWLANQMLMSGPEQHRNSWLIARLGCGCLPFLLFTTLFFCVSTNWVKALIAFLAIISVLGWRDTRRSEAVTRAVEMIAENETLYNHLTQSGKLSVSIRGKGGATE